jgi:hypothetical protein
MQTPDISFFAELLALIVCPIGLLMLAISLFFFSGAKLPPALAHFFNNPLLKSFDILWHFLQAHGADNFDDFARRV